MKRKKHNLHLQIKYLELFILAWDNTGDLDVIKWLQADYNAFLKQVGRPGQSADELLIDVKKELETLNKKRWFKWF